MVWWIWSAGDILIIELEDKIARPQTFQHNAIVCNVLAS